MLTAERLRELLDYDQATGIFKWRVKRGAERAGTILSSIDGYGYIQARVDYKLYRVHRLAWLHAYGTLPKYCIDHINGIKTDNRIKNLREATRAQNGMNRRHNKNNTTGYKGVTAHQGKFVAQIMVKQKCIYLGIFEKIEDAAAAYALAAQKYHGEFARFS